jgi:hypothetical protein
VLPPVARRDIGRSGDQLDAGRNLGKTNPLNDGDLAEFVELQKTHAHSAKSWSMDANPNTVHLARKRAFWHSSGKLVSY